MAKSLLTLNYLINLALSMAIANEQPFDACEGWEDWGDQTIHLRLCDRRASRRYPMGRTAWGYAFDEESWADGSEEEMILGFEVLEWPADKVRAMLIKAFPKRFDSQYVPLKTAGIMEEIPWEAGS